MHLNRGSFLKKVNAAIPIYIKKYAGCRRGIGRADYGKWFCHLPDMLVYCGLVVHCK